MPNSLVRSTLASCAIAVTSLCAVAQSSGAPQPGNVLVIVADDVGWDMVRAYGVHTLRPPTPTLDALAAQGVLFRSAYSMPWCSPTRAAMLTGRYCFRTGIGQVVGLGASTFSLPLTELTLAEWVRSASRESISTAAVGKWHLAVGPGAALHANTQGFDWFEGTLGNLEAPDSYFGHEKVVNGATSWSSRYATTEQVDDALARMDQLREPWLVYLAFNASHAPFHVPPAHLHTYAIGGMTAPSVETRYQAAVQAMDSEIGRLLASMDPDVRERTTVVFIGDNGTAADVALPPLSIQHAKGSLFEGGVHVPLIVAGRGVLDAGRECSALVSAVDVFATAAELLGVPVDEGFPGSPTLDSVSFAPYLRDATQPALRNTVYAESFGPNGFGPYAQWHRMVRDQRWKLIAHSNAPDELYDLQGTLIEGPNLLLGALNAEQRAAYTRLRRELTQIVGG